MLEISICFLRSKLCYNQQGRKSDKNKMVNLGNDKIINEDIKDA